MNMETWREGLFQLCWQQHGGSGLAVTLDDALDLPTTDRDWLIERIGSQRAREATVRLQNVPAGAELRVKAINQRGLESWDFARVTVR